MNPSRIITIEDKLTRFSFALLLLAAAYGIFAGAAVAMYYLCAAGQENFDAFPLARLFGLRVIRL